MAAFTKISEQETPFISLDPRNIVSKIDDNIYSGFCEHLGRCIYGGIYETESSKTDSNGFRQDVIEALKELNMPVVRYPGGNFVATYHWLDGVGPRDKRPKRPEPAWKTTESNQFGTDEFMQWCEALGTEPYLALNMGTGTLDEALAWVEYCNSSEDTYYANLRRQNGREKPYSVKYWALGNEVWGPWQVEQMTAEDYAKKAFQWAKALKFSNPDICLILCGKEGKDDWDRHVLKECTKWDPLTLHPDKKAPLIDMHSIHLYTADDEHLPNVTAPRAAERSIELTGALIDLARIQNQVPVHVPKPTICFDEWNVWSPVRAPAEKGGEEHYTLSDALAVAVWLNVFVRQSRYLGMCNIAQSVNVLSPLMTSKDGIWKQTTWFPLLLFCKYMRGHTISCNVGCGTYEGRTNPAWIRGVVETPWLDVSASLSDDGWVSLAVVNISEEKDWKCQIDGISQKKVMVYTITGDNLQTKNDMGEERVCIKESSWDGVEAYTFPKHSFTMLRWQR